jgi:hypothetical protein
LFGFTMVTWGLDSAIHFPSFHIREILSSWSGLLLNVLFGFSCMPYISHLFVKQGAICAMLTHFQLPLSIWPRTLVGWCQLLTDFL